MKTLPFRTIFKWVSLFLLMTAPIVLLEFSLHILYPKIVPWWGQEGVNAAIEGLLPRTKPNPYMGYENTPDYFANGIRQHNSSGYRMSAEVTVEKPDSVFRILVLGGSTTYGQGVDSPDESWPAVLQSLLNERFGGNSVEVINGGVPWASSLELLEHYLVRDRNLKPNLVIIHSGGNDTSPLKTEGYEAEYRHWRRLDHACGTEISRVERVCLKKSAIAKTAYGMYFSKFPFRTSGPYIHTNLNKDAEAALRNTMENEPTGFKRYLSMLIRNCLSDEADVIFFQFYYPAQGLFKNTQALERANSIVNYAETWKSLDIGLQKNELVARHICDSLDVPFVKIPQDSLPVRYFIDQCHLDLAGQKFKAEYMRPYVQLYVDSLRGKQSQ